MRFSFVADHFQYLASIGLLALLVAALSSVLRRLALPPAALPTVASMTLLLLGLLTLAQSFVYKDRPTLWQDTLAKNPESDLAHQRFV